jgi:hypothetical protein
MHSLRAYGQDEPVYDNNADTITSTCHGSTLKMYTSHLAPPGGPGTRPEYRWNSWFTVTEIVKKPAIRAAINEYTRQWYSEVKEDFLTLEDS